LILEVN